MSGPSSSLHQEFFDILSATPLLNSLDISDVTFAEDTAGKISSDRSSVQMPALKKLLIEEVEWTAFQRLLSGISPVNCREISFEPDYGGSRPITTLLRVYERFLRRAIVTKLPEQYIDMEILLWEDTVKIKGSSSAVIETAVVLCCIESGDFFTHSLAPLLSAATFSRGCSVSLMFTRMSGATQQEFIAALPPAPKIKDLEINRAGNLWDGTDELVHALSAPPNRRRRPRAKKASATPKNIVLGIWPDRFVHFPRDDRSSKGEYPEGDEATS